MILEHISTTYLIKEMETDGHSPLKFMCDNKEIYFCKYLVSVNREELTCLAYEIIASFLLKKLDIPTPDIALVTISKDTLIKSKIEKNKRLKEGNVCFGSKDVKKSLVLNDLTPIKSRRGFNQLENPADIIRIAIFDLWVNNMDRGRNIEPGFNYNILLKSQQKKEQVIAFDHGFIFGGVSNIGIFNDRIPLLKSNKLYLTPYYLKVIKYFTKEEFDDIANNFIHLLSNNYEKEIQEIFEQLPETWKLAPNLRTQIVNYLKSKKRLEEIRSIILHSKS